VKNGQYYTFTVGSDPMTGTWDLHTLVNEDGSASTLAQSYAYLALDPVSGCVIVMNGAKVYAFRA
jgi:hypothetical protein